jgi:hypothetical protein
MRCRKELPHIPKGGSRRGSFEVYCGYKEENDETEHPLQPICAHKWCIVRWNFIISFSLGFIKLKA